MTGWFPVPGHNLNVVLAKLNIDLAEERRSFKWAVQWMMDSLSTQINFKTHIWMNIMLSELSLMFTSDFFSGKPWQLDLTLKFPHPKTSVGKKKER